jgi:hypothetical protein
MATMDEREPVATTAVARSAEPKDRAHGIFFLLSHQNYLFCSAAANQHASNIRMYVIIGAGEPFGYDT